MGAREPKPLAEVLRILGVSRERRDRKVKEARDAFEADVVWALTLPLWLDDARTIRCRPTQREAEAAVGQHRSNFQHIFRRQGMSTGDGNWRGRMRRG